MPPRVCLASLIVLAVSASQALAGRAPSSVIAVTFDADPPIPILVDQTIAEVGRTRVIAVRLGTPTEQDARLAAMVEPEGRLEIVAEPVVLAGESIGYLRVRGLSEGPATLRIGDAEMAVHVIRPRVSRDESNLPRVIGPLAGAAVWGRLSVGVEFTVPPRHEEGRLWLELPDATRLEPTRISDASLGPDRRAVFEIDADSLPEGPCVLSPGVTLGSGLEHSGEPIAVRIIRPAPSLLTQGEAEARYDVERPRRFQDARITSGRSEEASGGAYFNNFSSYPALCFPVRVEHAGWHQVVIRASGTLAGGELPWVDVVVDGADNPATGGPLLSMRWHRMAVGRPVWLEPGTRIITPFFANDFYVPDAADRNLLIDTVEVCRVEPSPTDAGLELPSLDDLAGTRPGEPAPSMPGAATSAMSGTMAASMPAGSMIAMMPGGQSAGVLDSNDPMGERAAPVRVSLDRILHGSSLTGDLLVEGQAWTPQVRGKPPTAPIVSLVLNGQEIARQTTFAPRFLIDADAFETGTNTIELRAALPAVAPSSSPSVPRGAMGGAMTAAPGVMADVPGASDLASAIIARTPPQVVTFERTAQQPRGRVARTLRFGIHDPAWDERTRALQRAEHYPRERTAAAMYSAETIRLTLPESLTGSFRVGVESLGTNFEGLPELAIALESANQAATEIGRVAAQTWWDTRLVDAPVTLPPGPKTLLLSFTNDHYRPNAGDRNVWIQSLALIEVDPDEASRPRVAPSARLLYPRDADTFHLQGAVVAEACDDTGVERVELVINGVETGVRKWVRRQPGPFVLPLLARSLDPGEHTVSVRAYDEQGNIAESNSATIRVLATPPDELTPYDRAILLLDRLAFGPDDRELTAILTMGEHAWLADRLVRTLDDPGETAAMAPGLVWFEDARYDYGPPRRALEHAYYTPNPVRTRFVLWAQNHFSTWIRKAEGDRKWREHIEYLRLGVAPFQDLLLASARSPAMLRYLDQDQSFAGRLNENYAREIMELHTLGVHGGYTQADVTSLAALLTGWTASTLGNDGGASPRGFRFRFDPGVSTADPLRVLGLQFPQTARADRYDRALLAIEALAAHPSTAHYVATRLAEAYVSVPAPEPLVADLANVFERTGGDMAAMLHAMIDHPDFWDAARTPRVCTPLDYALRLARATRFHHPWRLSEYLQRAGFQVFDRSTPDGYPSEDSAFTDSNAMIQRWSLAQDAWWALASLIPDTWRWEGVSPDRAWAQKVVDAAAVGLTGRVLSDRSNQAAVELLLNSTAPIPDRIRLIAPFVAQLPEANLK